MCDPHSNKISLLYATLVFTTLIVYRAQQQIDPQQQQQLQQQLQEAQQTIK